MLIFRLSKNELREEIAMLMHEAERLYEEHVAHEDERIATCAHTLEAGGYLATAHALRDEFAAVKAKYAAIHERHPLPHFLASGDTVIGTRSAWFDFARNYMAKIDERLTRLTTTEEEEERRSSLRAAKLAGELIRESVRPSLENDFDALAEMDARLVSRGAGALAHYDRLVERPEPKTFEEYDTLTADWRRFARDYGTAAQRIIAITDLPRA